NVLNSYLKKITAVDLNTTPNPDEEPLLLTSWAEWGGVAVFARSNAIVLQGSVVTAGYVSDRLNKNLAGKSLILYISNTNESKFSMNRLLKVTVNNNDYLLKPKTNLHLISNEYAPAADGRIEYVIPNEFDGKIGFVFYEAQLNLLRISAFVKDNAGVPGAE
ncbi:MAG: hypothetical protein LBP80_09335, partial [Treponema sp.]|nr:hypothetical protein [Treponema sp.]